MESAAVKTPRDHPRDIEKFIDGAPIIDQMNPFKEPAELLIIDKDRNKESDEDISTEDVRNESKFVCTYIKRPDKYFTLDPGFKEERAAQSRPIPRSRGVKNNQQKVWKRRLIGGHAVYPDLADIKVRLGAADKEDVEYYDPAEVQSNALKFDYRFRGIKQFSSQDDLDTIAEQTEATIGDGEQDQVINNNLKSEPKNKSYTNTVSSREFKDYLRAKGLALVKLGTGNGKAEDMKQQPRTSHIPRPVAAGAEVHTNSGKKSSVLQRLLNRNRQLQVNSPNQKQSATMSRGRATATPQIQSNYSNAYYHDGAQARQRHSTPIKSTSVSNTAPQSQPHKLSVEYRRPVTTGESNNIRRANGYNGELINRKVVSCGGGGGDNNRSSMLHMPPNQQQFPISTSHQAVENIYESTDRLQKSRLSAPDGIAPDQRNNQLAAAPNNIEQKQRSLSRNEIYAHLFAFYQKSKRNSTSSEITLPGGRSQSRNSGTYLHPIMSVRSHSYRLLFHCRRRDLFATDFATCQQYATT